MNVEITGYKATKTEIYIYGEKADVRIDFERQRTDRENPWNKVAFCFEFNNRYATSYFKKWIHRQKATKDAKTYGEALSAIIGTLTSIDKRYRVFDETLS